MFRCLSTRRVKVLKMTKKHDFRHILRFASIYRRTFSVLILCVGLENLIEVNKKVALPIKKYPAFLILLLATTATTTGLVIQSHFPHQLPPTESVAYCFSIFSHWITFAFPLIQSIFNYREIHLFWCKLHEITCFAFTELGYEISFGYFWKRFFTGTVVCILVNAFNAAIRFWFYSLKTSFVTQCCGVLQREVITYIVVHALFIVNLNSFFNRLLIKYIDLDYRNRASNLVFDHVERSLLCQLRLFKQFHYKLWEMTTAVNGFFGLTLLMLSYHSFVDIAYAAYYIFLYIARRDPVTVLTSNFRFRICIQNISIPWQSSPL